MTAPFTLAEALQRMDDLEELDRTAIWPNGKVPRWVWEDMAAKGIDETHVAPVLLAIHSWPDIARTLRAHLAPDPQDEP